MTPEIRETPETPLTGPQTPPNDPGPVGSPQDPMEDARRLLAGIEADIRGGEADLARTLHEGHEHFRPGMDKATAGLEDANLDGWTDQAAAMARVQSATAGVKMPEPAKPEKES